MMFTIRIFSTWVDIKLVLLIYFWGRRIKDGLIVKITFHINIQNINNKLFNYDLIWIIVPVYCLQCFTKFIKYLCFIAIFLWIFIWIKYKEIPKMTITSCLHERYNFGRKNVWSACMHLCRQRSVVLMTWRGKKEHT